MEKVVFPAGEMPSSQMSGYFLPPHQEALPIEMMTVLLLPQHAPWFWQMPYCFGRKMENVVTQMLGAGLNLNLLFLIKVKSFFLSPCMRPVSSICKELLFFIKSLPRMFKQHSLAQ